MAIKFYEYVHNMGKPSKEINEGVDLAKVYGEIDLNLSLKDYRDIVGNVIKFYDAHSNEELKGFASEMEEDLDTIKHSLGAAITDEEKQGRAEIQKLIKSARDKYVAEGNRRMNEIMKDLRSLVAKK